MDENTDQAAMSAKSDPEDELVVAETITPAKPDEPIEIQPEPPTPEPEIASSSLIDPLAVYNPKIDKQTVTIAIQLPPVPEGTYPEHYTVLLGIRVPWDEPMLRSVEIDMTKLPPEVWRLLTDYMLALPDRAQAKAAAALKAAADKKTAIDTAQANATLASKAAIERKAAKAKEQMDAAAKKEAEKAKRVAEKPHGKKKLDLSAAPPERSEPAHTDPAPGPLPGTVHSDQPDTGTPPSASVSTVQPTSIRSTGGHSGTRIGMGERQLGIFDMFEVKNG